jgi:DNA-binding transcriptional ArsR family regulator
MNGTLDTAFAALADPTRRALLARVAGHPMRAGDLSSGFRMSRPAVSKHLRVLREAGLVEADKRGREQIYRLAPKGLEQVERYVEEVSRFWDVALDRFRRFAEGGPDGDHHDRLADLQLGPASR